MQVIELTKQQLNVIWMGSQDGVVAYQVNDKVFVGYGFNPSHRDTRIFDAEDFNQWLIEIDFENSDSGTIH